MIDSEGINRGRKDNSPRIMVCLDDNFDELVPISIDKYNPEILINETLEQFEKISDWIKRHYNVLMKHWNQEISDFESFDFYVRSKEILT